MLGWLPVVGVFKGAKYVDPKIMLTDFAVVVSGPGSYLVYSMEDHKVDSLSNFHEFQIESLIKEFRFILRLDGTIKSRYNKRIRRNMLRTIRNFHIQVRKSGEYKDRRNLSKVKWIELERQDNIVINLIMNPQEAVVSIGR
jgi:hypothetical protein